MRFIKLTNITLLIVFMIILGGCSTSTSEMNGDTTVQEKATESEQNTENVQDEPSEQKETTQITNEEQATKLGLEMVTVGRVIDGDTFETSDGRKIRLIGVNTPESTNRIEEYGKEASGYTKSMLEGKQVWMSVDVSNTDRYNRYLRIVWLDVPSNLEDEKEIRSKMFNANLVLNGYAEPSTYPPDVTYSDYFVKFAREAREQNKGLWSFGENGTTRGDLDSESSSSKSSSSSSNETSETTVVPSSTEKESYQNCTELRKVYPDGVPSNHPAYASKHDRDKDNWACER